ncbi:hypothetical protein Tco_0714041 [Tanacetum coccineum]
MPQKKPSKAKKTGKCHVCGDTGHYARDCKERKSDSEEVVLQDKTGKCHVCGETGHYARECKDTKSDTLKVVLDTTRKCHLCGYTGHYPRDCKERKCNVYGETAREYKYKKSERLDNSIQHSRDMFVDYNPMRNHELILDNNDHVDVAGIGTVVLRFTTGKGGRCIIKKSCEVIIGNGYGIEDGASHHGNILSTLFQLNLLEEQPVKKVVLDETIDLLASNEHPKLSKTRARGWYLLSRGTVHVCNSRDMFVDYLQLTGHEVVLENNSPVDVVGFGTVKLQLTSGKVLILENVFHMPKITKCCISVGKLIQMGFAVGFWGEGCDIKKDHDIVGKGYVEHEMYRLSVVDEHPSAEYDPMIDHEVNVDNDDNADVVGTVNSVLQLTTGKAKDTGFDITCGGRECVLEAGEKVIFKMYNDGVLYKLNFVLESPLPKVVHHETLGLLIANEHPKLAKARTQRWYLLTRCTVHVCNSRDMFVDYQPVTSHEVVLENNSHVDVVGYGTVKLQLTTGNVLTLKNVFHMPAIIRCCLSMNKLMEMGLGVAFHGEGCYVKKGDQIVGNGFVEDGLFRVGVIDERPSENQG